MLSRSYNLNKTRVKVQGTENKVILNAQNAHCVVNSFFFIWTWHFDFVINDVWCW